jgi:hypothetical protein
MGWVLANFLAMASCSRPLPTQCVSTSSSSHSVAQTASFEWENHFASGNGELDCEPRGSPRNRRSDWNDGAKVAGSGSDHRKRGGNVHTPAAAQARVGGPAPNHQRAAQQDASEPSRSFTLKPFAPHRRHSVRRSYAISDSTPLFAIHALE